MIIIIIIIIIIMIMIMSMTIIIIIIKSSIIGNSNINLFDFTVSFALFED